MSDLTALEKYSCPACGAHAEWNVRKQMLVCPFCGTESKAELETDTGKIKEHDLAKALREMPEEMRGWKAARKTVQCRSCKAITVFDPVKVGKNCDFCGSPELVDYNELKPPIRPESVLPFRVNQEKVYTIIKQWLGSRWFAPNNLKKRSLVDKVHGVYIPYWTFDSRVVCPWKAESGYYYYENRTVRDAQGKTRVERVRRTRWEPSAGTVKHVFDDLLIPGSRGIDSGLLRSVEPFPTNELVPYDAGYVSGWDVEHYQVILLDAAKQARVEKTRILDGLCSGEVPGDTHRGLKIFPEFSAETFKHLLAPVWLLAYDYGRQKKQVVVNAVTGKIAGYYPKSVWKITFAVLGVLLLLLVIFFVVGRG